ncbi:hypothetical protein RI129_010679 [Pyrocoelia pectoralis]|uniref:Uncharacterized protein n=1 Tax=Pyrocoelia pectoralis TaxID=417401 RepID=A0AAN7V3S5_9COLE
MPASEILDETTIARQQAAEIKYTRIRRELQHRFRRGRSTKEKKHKIELNGQPLEQLSERIGKVGRLYKHILRKKGNQTQVHQTLTYGSESCILTKRNKSSIKVAEMRFVRNIQGITN